jgi:hypothetical protein
MAMVHPRQSFETAYKFLEIANRHVEIKPMLLEFIAELRTFTDCAAIGIRLLDSLRWLHPGVF